mgnify:FL=1
MPSHEQVEQFFMDFAVEMRNEGEWIMDDYKHDWCNLMTEDQLRTERVEEQTSIDDSDDDY